MTYGDLKERVDTMDQAQLGMTVTVFDPNTDEYIPVCDMFEEDDSDVIDCEDAPHPVLELAT